MAVILSKRMAPTVMYVRSSRSASWFFWCMVWPSFFMFLIYRTANIHEYPKWVIGLDDRNVWCCGREQIFHSRPRDCGWCIQESLSTFQLPCSTKRTKCTKYSLTMKWKAVTLFFLIYSEGRYPWNPWWHFFHTRPLGVWINKKRSLFITICFKNDQSAARVHSLFRLPRSLELQSVPLYSTLARSQSHVDGFFVFVELIHFIERLALFRVTVCNFPV